MEVQSTQHNANIGIEQAAIRDSLEVFWLSEFAVVGGVCAADVWDAFGIEFLFYAAFAEDEDFVLWRRELENAGDVYRGTVRGSKDFFLLACQPVLCYRVPRYVPPRQGYRAFRTSSCSPLGTLCCCW